MQTNSSPTKFVVIGAMVMLFLTLLTCLIGILVGSILSQRRTAPLTETEAKIIAEKSCIKGGESIGDGWYEDTTKEWVFHANTNATREGCESVCKVNTITGAYKADWNCVGAVEPDPIPDEPTCGVTNCHGLEVTCGLTTGIACTQVYQLGDKCRQYAKCGLVNDNCQLEESDLFNVCKSCVQKCQQNTDAQEQFNCEANCQ